MNEALIQSITSSDKEATNGLDFLPTVSIIIPTLNSEKTLEPCLRSVLSQDYPFEKLEIVVVDGGSSDGTLSLVKRLQLPIKHRILPNELKTGEAAKALGLKKSTNEILALIDSDNILPSPNWLRLLVKPLEDSELIASEPLAYEYRREDSYITRYSALIGMNDPLCLFLGNYDRYCRLTGRWTDLELDKKDKGSYIEVTLNGQVMPTIGANGFLIRKKALDNIKIGNYFFDIDILYSLSREKPIKIAKVKTSIIHLFAGNMKTFARKQRRRMRDYNYYNQLNIREYPWGNFNKLGLLKFVFYNISFLPLVVQSIKGFVKYPDRAWFFHPIACEITLWEYGWGKIAGFFRTRELSRENWGR